MAPNILKIKYDTLSLNRYINRIIIVKDKSPPDKLKTLAIHPRVENTKIAFNSATEYACFFPIKNRTYITAIFDKPNLTPGIAIGNGGNEFSITDKMIATAKKSEVNTSFCVFPIILPHHSVVCPYGSLERFLKSIHLEGRRHFVQQYGVSRSVYIPGQGNPTL